MRITCAQIQCDPILGHMTIQSLYFPTVREVPLRYLVPRSFNSSFPGFMSLRHASTSNHLSASRQCQERQNKPPANYEYLDLGPCVGISLSRIQRMNGPLQIFSARPLSASEVVSGENCIFWPFVALTIGYSDFCAPSRRRGRYCFRRPPLLSGEIPKS